MARKLPSTEMNKTTPRKGAPPAKRRGAGRTLAALGLLALAALVAYRNSLNGPFIFDDAPSIVRNPDIRHLATTLRENPNTLTAIGRPLLRISLWINYALGGLQVRGYHILNLILHILASWTLWGVARRIFESPCLRDRYGKEAWGLALAIALLWTTHPLQTESVTYVVQRAEILGGWFYLLTLYSVARRAGEPGPHSSSWSVAAVVSCALGMASKETVATAPLLAIAMDRVFFARSWNGLWRARKGVYLGLASTWIFQAALVIASLGRHRTAGFGFGMDWWSYALTQPYYLCRYLWLSLWPSALVFDYGPYLARTVAEIAPYAAVVLTLLVLTVVGLWRKPEIGFCGLWFFLILAPTSSLVPMVTQTGAERRMYLPLAGLIGLGVVALYSFWRRLWRERPRMLQVASAVSLTVGVAALSARTIARNEDYQSELSIWRSVVEQWPLSPRAHNNLGFELANAGRTTEAIAEYEAALRLASDFEGAHVNLGNALESQGRLSEAIDQYENALHLDPNDAMAHLDLGNALTFAGRLPEAIAQYETAVRLRPEYVKAHLNLGTALARSGRLTDAIDQYETALRLEPDLAGGPVSEAIVHLKEQQRQPSNPSDGNGVSTQK
jgi:tetratricopeptide (TPR) repeat protein